MTLQTTKQREYYNQIISLAEQAGDTQLVSHLAHRLADLVNGMPIPKEPPPAPWETPPAEKSARKKRHLSAAAKERIAAAQRERWRLVREREGKGKKRR